MGIVFLSKPTPASYNLEASRCSYAAARPSSSTGLAPLCYSHALSPFRLHFPECSFPYMAVGVISYRSLVPRWQ